MLDRNSCLNYKKLFSEVLPWFNPVLAHYIVREFVKVHTEKIVDMGMGPGYLVMEMAKITSAQVLGIDYNPAMLKIAEETLQESGTTLDNIELFLEDVHNLSFPDNSVDLIVSYSCFHHWNDPVQAIQECIRILKVGGTLLLIDSLPGDEKVFENVKKAIKNPEIYFFVEKAIKRELCYG